MQHPIFITGIGTDINPTIVSAILVEALQADYWKPVQASLMERTDSEFIRSIISNTKTIIKYKHIELKTGCITTYCSKMKLE